MAWNVFKLCTGLKVLGSVMILVVLSVVGVSYYAVVVANYVPQVWKGASATATALLVLILFHLLVRVFSLCPSLCLILFSSSDFLISLLFS
jgi:palmitoyltransferase